MEIPLLWSVAGAGFTLAAAYALGLLLMRRRPGPPEIVLGIGAAALSVVLFVILLLNAASLYVFLATGAAAMAMAWRFRVPSPNDAVRVPRPAWVIFGAYGVWYLVNALAPETTADGITYHLGLPREYLRLGGFPEHTTFYDVIPRGMEMLYTMAYSIGRHAAAKLLEFTFFAATIPLLFRLGRRLGAPDLACTVAAVFYFCAPVAGLTGSSSYNDAAGVFFMLAVFYLLLEEGTRYLLPAGLLAGFCYAIKLPGLVVGAAAVVFAARQRRWRPVLIVAAGAALAIAPWMLHAVVLTGNPLAPLMNGLFPNPYFHAATEQELAAGLRSLGGISPAQVPWELAFGDHLTGTFGPMFLALPIGLVALRRRQGRLLWAAALLLALPWLTNTGARFLMPAVTLGALALGMSLPRPAAWAAIALQAILCWPQVLALGETRYRFRLHEFPLAAAIGTESEGEYCKRRFDEYNVARMIERVTPPDSRTLALLTVANAYLDRDIAVTWQSAEGDQLLDTLRLASLYSTTPTFDWKVTWPEAVVRTLRFHMPEAYPGEWDINEVQLFSGDDRLFNSPQWTLAGWPNPWEAPLAFDGNLATRWRTWEHVRPGMYLDVELGNPQRLTAAVLVTHTAAFRVPLEVYGQDVKGRWRLLTRSPQAVARPPQDMRLEASRALKRAGFRYLLVPTGSGGNAPIGNVLVGHEAEWGLERAGEAGRFYLLHVK
ncbi:MAG: discoidin domain-containing protein [Candidatus Solibacter sp.]